MPGHTVLRNGHILFYSSSVIHKARLHSGIGVLFSCNTGRIRVHVTYPPLVCKYPFVNFASSGDSLRLVAHQVVGRVRNSRGGGLRGCTAASSPRCGGVIRVVTSHFNLDSLGFGALRALMRTVKLPGYGMYARYFSNSDYFWWRGGGVLVGGDHSLFNGSQLFFCFCERM